MNNNASNSDHLGMSLPRIIYLLSFSPMVAILVANVYVNKCVECPIFRKYEIFRRIKNQFQTGYHSSFKVTKLYFNQMSLGYRIC